MVKGLKHSVTGGDPTSVVFSVPLHGGSSEEWVAGRMELPDRFQGSSSLQLDRQRCRHRVSPKTTLARPPVAFPFLTELLLIFASSDSMTQ
jgi:hypothetical protein